MSACVYSSEEALWEDLLYLSLEDARRHRRIIEREMPELPPTAHRPYALACARARVHLYNLAAREWLIPPLLVEMARSEGLV